MENTQEGEEGSWVLFFVYLFVFAFGGISPQLAFGSAGVEEVNLVDFVKAGDGSSIGEEVDVLGIGRGGSH